MIYRLPTFATMVVAALLLGGLALPAAAQEITRPEIVDIRVGYDNHYKIAHWTPVEVTFQGGTDNLVGQVEFITADGDGAGSRVVHPRKVQLLPGGRARVLSYLKFGSRTNNLKVIFRVERKAIIDETIPNVTSAGSDRLSIPWAMDPGEQLILNVGASIGAEEAALLQQRAGNSKTEVARIDDVGLLPTEWYGYDGVDAVIISTSQPERLGKLADTGARLAALDRWLDLGGKLVLTCGAQAPTVLAADAPLARFSPGKFAEPTTLRRTAALESYIGGARKIPHAPGREVALAVPRLEDVQGVIDVAEANLPLVVRTPRHFGQVVFVAVDLDREPFAGWDGRAQLVARLLGQRENLENLNNNNVPAGIANYGGRLVSQIQHELDSFTGVKTVPFALVALMILGYIALIGPGDYLLVKRVLKRMELTWITFPLWVVLVSGGAYFLAVYSKGDDLRLNQVDLVDVDVASGLARSTSWINLFTPQSGSFDLAVVPHDPSGDAVAQSDCLLAWMASSNNVYGNGGSGGLFGGTYTFAPELNELLGVPIQVWSTKAFLNRAAYQTKQFVTADLTMAPDRVPEGTLHNDLDVELTDCLLLSGRAAFTLGNLAPGATVAIKPGQQGNLENILRGATFTNFSGDIHDKTALASVLYQMMFCRAVGGASTVLLAGDQEFVDLSDLLPLDRAILVGRAKRPAAQLTGAGQALSGPSDKHWTVYRFVFPIKHAATIRE